MLVHAEHQGGTPLPFTVADLVDKPAGGRQALVEQDDDAGRVGQVGARALRAADVGGQASGLVKRIPGEREIRRVELDRVGPVLRRQQSDRRCRRRRQYARQREHPPRFYLHSRRSKPKERLIESVNTVRKDMNISILCSTVPAYLGPMTGRAHVTMVVLRFCKLCLCGLQSSQSAAACPVPGLRVADVQWMSVPSDR